MWRAERKCRGGRGQRQPPLPSVGTHINILNQVLGPPSKLWPGATVRSQNVETHLAEIRWVDAGYIDIIRRVDTMARYSG